MKGSNTMENLNPIFYLINFVEMVKVTSDRDHMVKVTSDLYHK